MSALCLLQKKSCSLIFSKDDQLQDTQLMYLLIHIIIISLESYPLQLISIQISEMKRQRQDDPEISQQLKAIMHDLKCSNSHMIRRVCDNVNCQFPALFCGEKQCQQCTEMHLNCRSYSFQKFTKLVQKRTSEKIIEIENSMIESIQKQKRRYAQKFSLDETTVNLDKKYFKMIEDIFKNKDSKAVNGRQASQLFEKLEETQIDADSRQQELLESFKKQSDRVMKEYMSMKDWIYDSALGHQHINRKLKEKKQENAWIKSNVLVAKNLRATLRELINSANKKVAMFSKIIQDELEHEDKQFLKDSFNLPNIKIDLVFRASENDFSASRFHEVCDNVQNTLFIAQNQFGKTFAGFTSLTWFGEKRYKSDEENTSFMLSFDEKIKLTLLNKNKAIYCSQSLGPTFGGETNYLNIFSSYDLLIGDKCNTTASSYYQFPRSYQFHQRSTDAFNIFGIEKGKKFKILEYQVFKISIAA